MIKLDKALSSKEDGFDSIVGRSIPMRKVFEMIEKVAKTEANILILGESGTGKELVARSIHSHSNRRDKPFVPVDCGALPESLLESELFGYEKGAFTGALTQRPGIFEFANYGTLFFDEVSNFSLSLQAKLLRVLQERQFRRVGGRKLIGADIRIISASNQDLKKAVEEGKFREDLYYRLNVISIILPPLKERKGDIPLLAKYYLKKYSRLNHRTIKGISKDAMRFLEEYSWPGNVRELQNVIERAVSLTENEIIQPEDLPTSIRKNRTFSPIPGHFSFKETKRRWVDEFEKEYLKDLLKRTDGNITRAAKEAGLNRKTIYRLLKKHNFRKQAVC